jgi:hypothetical protein
MDVVAFLKSRSEFKKTTTKHHIRSNPSIDPFSLDRSYGNPLKTCIVRFIWFLVCDEFYIQLQGFECLNLFRRISVAEKNQAALSGISPATHPTPYQRQKRGNGWVRTTLSICAVVIITALSACSPATSTPTNPTIPPPAASLPQPTAVPTLAPSPTTAPFPIPASTSTPAAATQPPAGVSNTALDPCLLISSQEASTLAGASFGPGAEETTPEGLKICTYGANTTNVFMVDVAQAQDVATAQAYKAQFLADLQANLQQLTNAGMTITQLPNFADGATMGMAKFTISGVTLSGSAIGFLKGKTFFGFSDLVRDGASPTSDALQSEATTVLARLP